MTNNIQNMEISGYLYTLISIRLVSIEFFQNIYVRILLFILGEWITYYM